MRILIVGAGKVGHTLAEHLVMEKHDVVIVDKNEEVIQRHMDTLDAMCVRGSGANARVLMEAEADKADIIIATTASDETNMLCCLMAKRLGAKYAIARVRDPDYNDSLNMLRADMGIDMAINPERTTALEISRLLRFPTASNIESFARGRVEMVEFRALEGDAVVGCPLKDVLQSARGMPQVLCAAVERDGKAYIPDGDFVIQPGDKVHVAADVMTITAFFRYLGRNNTRTRNVFLMGGGRISYYLAKMVIPLGMHVTVVEIDEKKANVLSEALPEANVIFGDGTDQELLEQEGLGQTDAFVALGNRDEENLMTGLFAVRRGVPKVIVKNNRVTYAGLLAGMGLDSIVSPKALTCASILRYVRGRANSQGTKVERLYRLMDGKAEAMEFIARQEDPYIGVSLKDLNVRAGTRIAAIVRRGKVFVPFGNDHVEAGDSVVVVACENGISDLNEVIRK